MTSDVARPAQGTLVISIPPDSSYVSVLRSAAAGLAAMLDWTLDELEDLRIAVDEATAMLLRLRPSGPLRMECAQPEPGALRITVRAATDGDAVVRKGTFGWTVLTALADSVEATVDGTTTSIVLCKQAARRGEAVS